MYICVLSLERGISLIRIVAQISIRSLQLAIVLMQAGGVGAKDGQLRAELGDLNVLRLDKRGLLIIVILPRPRSRPCGLLERLIFGAQMRDVGFEFENLSALFAVETWW